MANHCLILPWKQAHSASLATQTYQFNQIFKLMRSSITRSKEEMRVSFFKKQVTIIQTCVSENGEQEKCSQGIYFYL